MLKENGQMTIKSNTLYIVYNGFVLVELDLCSLTDTDYSKSIAKSTRGLKWLCEKQQVQNRPGVCGLPGQWHPAATFPDSSRAQGESY